MSMNAWWSIANDIAWRSSGLSSPPLHPKSPFLGRAAMAEKGRVSRTHRLRTTVRNCTRDEGGPFEAGSQVQVSSHRKLRSSRAMVVLCQEGARAPCCTRDEGGPFGAVL